MLSDTHDEVKLQSTEKKRKRQHKWVEKDKAALLQNKKKEFQPQCLSH